MKLPFTSIGTKSALGLLMLLAVFVASCSDEGQDSTIDLRIESFALTLDPKTIADTESMKVASLLYSPLVAVNIDGTAESRLAESWEQVDEQTMRFTLRDGITFSDSTPVTTADVVHTICSAMQPTSVWSWALASISRDVAEDGSYECIGLRALDERTLEIHQTKPVKWLLDALDGPPGWVVPEGAKPGEYGVLPGTGPYTLEKVVPDKTVELVPRPVGAALKPRAERVVFHFVPDIGLTIRLFEDGRLDAFSLTSPQLVNSLVQPGEPPQLKQGGTLIIEKADRARFVIVNEKSLVERGYSKEQVEALKAQLWTGVDRERIAGPNSRLLLKPLYTAFLPAVDWVEVTSPETAVLDLPDTKLEILTESDPFSDSIAAIVSATKLPNVELSYRVVDKSLLINSLVKQDYDIIITLIDANIHAPEFWASFFTPGESFVVFGKPIPKLKQVDLSEKSGLIKAARLIDDQGNWIPLVRENRLFAMRPNITGIRFTPTGQPRFESIGFGGN